jgi:hypothetical protein
MEPPQLDTLEAVQTRLIDARRQLGRFTYSPDPQ